eukprot:scaffold4599_cov219-Amphora_coffeaeformis.AAC.12
MVVPLFPWVVLTLDAVDVMKIVNPPTRFLRQIGTVDKIIFKIILTKSRPLRVDLSSDDSLYLSGPATIFRTLPGFSHTTRVKRGGREQPPMAFHFILSHDRR